MPKDKLDDSAKEKGARLGKVIQGRRGLVQATAEVLAHDAGMKVDTLRNIERGRTANPGVFFVASIAAELGTTVDSLLEEASS